MLDTITHIRIITKRIKWCFSLLSALAIAFSKTTRGISTGFLSVSLSNFSSISSTLSFITFKNPFFNLFQRVPNFGQLVAQCVYNPIQFFFPLLWCFQHPKHQYEESYYNQPDCSVLGICVHDCSSCFHENMIQSVGFIVNNKGDIAIPSSPARPLSETELFPIPLRSYNFLKMGSLSLPYDSP